MIAFHGTCGNDRILRMQLRPLLDRFPIRIEEGHRIVTERLHPRLREMRDLFGRQHLFREYCVSHLDGSYSDFQYALDAHGTGDAPSAYLGFSQGALIALMMAAQTKCRKLVLFCPPSVESLLREMPHLFTAPLSTACCVVRGARDEIVPPYDARLDSLFEEPPLLLHHDNGHKPFPETGDDTLNRLASFLEGPNP